MMRLQTDTNILLLPNPDLEDEEGLKRDVLLRRAMDGTRHTHVKTSTERRLTFVFTNIGQGKLLELEQFLRANFAKTMFLETFRGQVWQGFIANEPDISVEGRSNPAGGSRKEQGSFTLEFVGVLT